jgi:hypothetical protein
MSFSSKPFSVKKDDLYYFYKNIVLEWETEWKAKRFLYSEGSLGSWAHQKSMNLKVFDSTDKLNLALNTEFSSEAKKFRGIFWMVKKDTKPKDTLRHLRNAFSHAHFSKCQKNKIECLAIQCIDKNKIKAQGYIPIDDLKGLITAILTCYVDD